MTVAAVAGPASAFDYPEHQWISAIAIEEAIAHGGEARADWIDAYRDVARYVLRGGEYACDPEGENVWGVVPPPYSEPACLSLADVPALEGDEAPSPFALKWRWFDDCTKHSPNSFMRGGGRAFGEYDSNEDSPETVVVHRPYIRSFAEYVRFLHHAHWPMEGGEPSDSRFEELDESYATLAERGHPHFRPPLAMPDGAFVSARHEYRMRRRDPLLRRRSKPYGNAFAWYADMHLGALEYANAAHRARVDAAREIDPRYRAVLEVEAKELIAVSLFLEMSALHYLEDSVAPGHIVTDADNLTNGETNATHAAYCENGLVVKEPGFCRGASAFEPRTPELTKDWKKLCARGPIRIYGDHLLSRNHPLEIDAPDVRATMAFAIAISSQSMIEVLEVYSDGAADLEAADRQCLETVAPCNDGTAPSCRSSEWNYDAAYDWPRDPSCKHPEVAAKAEPIYKCLFSWWDTATWWKSEDGDVEHHRQVGLRHAFEETRYFQALKWVPEPLLTETEAPENIRFWSQTGFRPSLWSVVGGGISGRKPNELEPYLRANLGVAWGPPRYNFPLQLAGGLDLWHRLPDPVSGNGSGRGSERIGGTLGLQGFASTTPFFLGFDVSVGRDLGEDDDYVRSDIDLLSWQLVNHHSISTAIGLDLSESYEWHRGPVHPLEVGLGLRLTNFVRLENPPTPQACWELDETGNSERPCRTR